MEFTDLIIERYRPSDPQANCRNITFQVTDDCCLNCSYCYQTHKGHNMMSIDTAKKIIDLLFRLYDNNDENQIINHHTKGLVLEFIGGEPFMNVDTMHAAVDYFMQQCIEKEHPWLTNFRIAISSNGVLYFEPKVQQFLQKYNKFIHLNITIDGPKQVHDVCRKDYDGKGSFDRSIAAWDAVAAQQGVKNMHTKITIAPENLPYLEDIFNFFLSKGCKNIHANPIYEHEWLPEEATKYYFALLEIANRLIEEKASSSLFQEFVGKPMVSTDTNNYCGGTASMLAFDPEGNAYPCLRYMKSSLGDAVPPIIIGNYDNIYHTPEYQAIYKDMKSVTRQSQSSPECLSCMIAGGCAWCSAANYQLLGSYNKRSTNICWMHRARALANVYYWNMIYRFNNSEKRHPLQLSRDLATQIINDQAYDRLLCLSSNN